MRSVALLALLAAAAPQAVRADEPAAGLDAIVVTEVPGPLPEDPGAALWEGLPGAPVLVAPQRAIRLNDKQANQALVGAGAATVTLRAAADAARLALVLDWADPTEDRVRPDATDAFGDGAALQIPLRFGAGQRLPFIGMGDEQAHVALWMQRVAKEGVVVREAVAAGFGSTTRADLGGAKMAMRYDGARKAWRALWLLPLAAGAPDLRQGLVPFAVALWDGARGERGGNKALSGWRVLRLARHPLDLAFARELAWGRAPGELGDPARGKVLTEAICAPCHVVGEKRMARPGLAPDLSSIGAVATPAYLRESLVDPSAVIVPNPPAAQHQDRRKPAGVSGPLPDNDAFVWSKLDASGKRVSKMPAFAGLQPADLNAIVAYMATLGAAAPGPGRKP